MLHLQEQKENINEARRQEIARRAQSFTNVGIAIDQALKKQ